MIRELWTPFVFRQDVTITFTTLKTAHLLSPAKEYCGEIVVADVGIPHNLVAQQEADIEVAEEGQIESMLNPRKQNTNKGDYGHLLCICGSEGMAGAAVMCGKAACCSEQVWYIWWFQKKFIRL